VAPSRYLYLNGRIVPYGEALIHVQSGAVKYGTSVFEGLRAYWRLAPAPRRETSLSPLAHARVRPVVR